MADAARRLCEEKGIKFTALRPSSIIGPGDYFAVPTVIRNILEGRMVLVGGGDNTVPFAHPSDVASAHLLALQHIDENDGEAFHLASFHVPFREYVAAYCRELGVDPVTRRLPYFLAYVVATLRNIGPFSSDVTRFTVKFISSHSVLDQTKITERLGWNPKYDLEKTVRETVEWYQTEKPSLKPE
ncbi:MAG: NAD-dependent epimerase/dehydratase family protein, partial [Candidatus Geothermarchaeales archaeon]